LLVSLLKRKIMTQSPATGVAKTDGGCSVGCFTVRGGASSDSVPPIPQENTKSRHCHTNSLGTANWKCPDPGCKTINPSGKDSCATCHLPRHSTHQFKRGESKILKQL